MAAGRRRRLRARAQALADASPVRYAVIGAAFAAVAFLVSSTQSGVIGTLRLQLYDVLLRSRDVRVMDDPARDPIVLVAIGAESMVGGSAVPREHEAAVIRWIASAEPRAIVLDRLWEGRDPGARGMTRLIEESASLAKPARDQIIATAAKIDPDRAMAEALEGTPSVLGFLTVPEEAGQTNKVDLPLELALDARNCEGLQPATVVRAFPENEFLLRAKTIGNALVIPDSDQSLRNYQLFSRVGDQLYPSMALVAAGLYLEVLDYGISVDCDPDRGHAVSGMNLGTWDGIPIAPNGTLRIDFGGQFIESFQNRVSFADILAEAKAAEEGRTPPGKISPDRFAGKAVFVGVVDKLIDTFQTPHDPAFSGVGIHAAVAHSLIERHFLRRPVYFFWEGLLGVAVVALATMLIVLSRSPYLALGVAVLLPLGGFFASRQLASAGILFDAILPGVVGMLTIFASTTARWITERRRAEQERDRAEKEELRAEGERLRAERLGAFLSPEVAKIAGENPELLKPQRQEISILFSDIRSFTTMTEGMPPEDLAIMLSEYLTWMTEIVLSNKGTLDKYIGDAVMAIFGAPLPEQAHARWACTTALEMMDALDSLNERWLSEGRKTLAIGIGINSGSVVVGTMGSKNKPEYTCIGDEVNFASRAEGLTKAYGATIIVGEPTMKLAGDDFLFRDLGPVKVKGKTKGVKIYELLGTKARVADMTWVDTFHQGLNAFLLRDWAKAEELFDKVRQAHPGDGPAKAFLVWTKSFRMHPPDEAWDGTLERAEK